MPVPVMVAIAGSARGLMAALSEASGGLKGLAAMGGAASAQLGAAGLGGSIATLAGIGKASIQMSADFESAMTKVFTSTSQTEEQVKVLGDGIRKLALDSTHSAIELADAARTINFFEGAESLEVLRVASQGATLGIGDLSTTVKSLSTIMFAFKIPADDAARTMDVLLESVRNGNAELGDLSLAFANVAPVASLAGVSLDEVAAAMAVMTSQGTPAVRAGTQLRMTISQLQRITPGAAKAMENFGVSATDVAAKLGERGLVGTLEVLTTAIDTKLGSSLSGMDTQLAGMATGSLEEFKAGIESLPVSQQTAVGALADMVGGVESLQGALQLLGPNMKTTKDLTAEFGNISTKAGEDLSKMGAVQDDLNTKWGKFKNRLKEVAMQIGEQLMPHAEKLLGVLDKFAKWAEDNEGTINMVVKGIGVALAIAAAVAAAGFIALAAVALVLGGAFQFVEDQINGVKAALEFMGRVATNVGGWLKDAFGNVKSFVGDALSGIGSTISNAFGNVRSTIANAFSGVGSFIGGVFTGAREKIGQFITWLSTLNPGQVIQNAFAGIANIITGIGNSIAGFFNRLTALFQQHGGIIGLTQHIWSTVWGTITGFLGGIIGAVFAWAGQMLSAAASAFGGFLSSAISFMSQLPGIIGGFLASAIGTAIGFLGSLVAAGWSMFGQFLSAAMSTLSQLPGIIGGAISSAVGAARGFVGSFFSVGVDIVMGMVRGIMSVAQSVASAAANVVRSAIGAAKAAVGIGSPSKDFKLQVGIPIGQGIIQGIMQTQGDVDKAVGNLVRHPLSGSFSVSALGGKFRGAGTFGATAQTGGGTTVINLNLNGTYYGHGGVHQAAMDIRNELLRVQKHTDLGFAASGSIRIG